MFASEHEDIAALGGRLRDTDAVTPALVAEIIDLACRRLFSRGQTARTVRIEQLIDAGAWTDVALALIDMELPQWQIRRVAYDAGEWYCALSRQRELPDWLDQSVEGHHADFTLALLSALVEAQCLSAPPIRSSVPAVRCEADPLSITLCCDNFA